MICHYPNEQLELMAPYDFDRDYTSIMEVDKVGDVQRNAPRPIFMLRLLYRPGPASWTS
jgi:hypothetical protein